MLRCPANLALIAFVAPALPRLLAPPPARQLLRFASPANPHPPPAGSGHGHAGIKPKLADVRLHIHQAPASAQYPLEPSHASGPPRHIAPTSQQHIAIMPAPKTA